MKTFEEKFKFLKKQGLSDFLIYQLLDWPIEAKNNTNPKIRLEYYLTKGFTEEAKYDPDWLIRIEFYQNKGFTEEAKKDEDSRVRLEYYRAKSFPNEALQDEDLDIKETAEKYFKYKKLLETFEKGKER